MSRSIWIISLKPYNCLEKYCFSLYYDSRKYTFFQYWEQTELQLCILLEPFSFLHLTPHSTVAYKDFFGELLLETSCKKKNVTIFPAENMLLVLQVKIQS